MFPPAEFWYFIHWTEKRSVQTFTMPNFRPIKISSLPNGMFSMWQLGRSIRQPMCAGGGGGFFHPQIKKCGEEGGPKSMGRLPPFTHVAQWSWMSLMVVTLGGRRETSSSPPHPPYGTIIK